MARLTRRPLKTFAPKNQLPNVLRSRANVRTFDQIRSIRFFGAKVSSGRSRKIKAKCAPFTPCRHSLGYGEMKNGAVLRPLKHVIIGNVVWRTTLVSWLILLTPKWGNLSSQDKLKRAKIGPSLKMSHLYV